MAVSIVAGALAAPALTDAGGGVVEVVVTGPPPSTVADPVAAGCDLFASHAISIIVSRDAAATFARFMTPPNEEPSNEDEP
jgi:hypothetical protein